MVPGEPPGGRMGSKENPLFSATAIELPVVNEALVSAVPAVREIVVVASGAVKAGFWAVPLGQPGHWALSALTIGGIEATCTAKACVGAVPTMVTPFGRKDEIGIV